MSQNRTLIFLLLSFLFSLSIQKDINTFSNYEQIEQTKIEANFDIDFDNSLIHGTVKTYFKANTDGEVIILDTRGLKILSIIDSDTGEELPFILDEQYELDANGIPLKIYRTYSSQNIFAILIKYETTSEGSAVQWLTPEQTTGKVYPFMFTQCESILCRELLPTQDTPAIKVVVNIGLTVKKPLFAVESGIYQGKIDNGDSVTYFYEQNIKIPAYLIAIAAGAIEERVISDRTKVYGEKELVDLAAYEFEDTEQFIEIAESYTIPYEWGEYNLLILPSSFPFGGMENPALTFVTPSIIAGDKSLANVIAHEISHSWSGNLVTMDSWTDFWLNEGFTMFLQRKIMETFYDKDMAKLDAMVGYSLLKEDIIKFGPSKSFTSMRPYLVGRHADDAFNEIPYEKGFNFLYYLENLINSKSEIDLFRKILRRYFEKFKYKSIHYEDFKSFFIDIVTEELPTQAESILAQIDWKDWMEKPGFPKVTNDFTNKYSIEAEENLELFYKDELTDDFVEVFKAWHTIVKQFFLRQIRENDKDLTEVQEKLLTESLNLKEGYNAEVNFEYFMIILTRWRKLNDDVKEKLIKFLGAFGRLKYLRPLYIAFYGVDKETCINTFEKYKRSYHPIAVRLIELDLKQLE